jgi:ketosteroid isomerase-like protein/quercetin dioxygenase-like cupin family protein
MRITQRMAARLGMMVMAVVAIVSTASAQQGDEAAIRLLSNKWQQDIAKQDIDAIVALHASDAVVLMSHAPAAKGSAAICQQWKEGAATPGLVLRWTPIKINVVSPTVATEYGTYTESYDTPQGKGTDEGSYIVIWNKINGKWKVALDAPVTSIPLPPPTGGTAAAAAAPVMDPSTMETHAANELTWTPLNVPGFSPGAKMAVLHGDPAGPGAFVLRLSFPDGYQIPVHWHPAGENATVVQGSLSLGMGNSFDVGLLHAYGVGDFAYLPPQQSHYGQAHGATIVQINGRGPFAINTGAAPK